MPFYFKAFDSKMASREKLFKAAIDFANKIGRERLVNITHSEDHDNIVITIWYWSDQEEKEDRQVKTLGEFKAPPTTKPPSAPQEKSEPGRVLEQAGTAQSLEKSGAARTPEPTPPLAPTQVQEIILPPVPPKPPEKSVEDSW
jgi:hypothetical protein